MTKTVTLTFEAPATFTYAVKGASVTIETDKLGPDTLAHIFDNGLKRKHTDSMGGADRTVEDRRKTGEAVRDGLYANEWSSRGQGDGMGTTLAVVNFGVSMLKKAGDSSLYDRFKGFSAKAPKDGGRSPRDVARLEWAEANADRVAAWAKEKADLEAKLAKIKASITVA